MSEILVFEANDIVLAGRLKGRGNFDDKVIFDSHTGDFMKKVPSATCVH